MMSHIPITFGLFPIILIGFFLTGCSKEKNTTDYPAPSSERYDGALVLKRTAVLIGQNRYAVDYGTLTVSENRQMADSRFIHLPVIRVLSSSKKPLPPVFYFGGGPGRSNMANLEGMWYLMPQHDVILVGFRGVDGNSLLSCPEVQEAMKGGEGELLSQKSLENIGRAWSSSAQKLTDEGFDLNGYTMLEVIEDNELARKALGYNRINLKSTSYGTRIAYIYGLKHPESIHRSAMLAVNPPGRFVWEPEIIDEQLRYFSKLWSQDPEASLKSADLYGDMMAVLSDMPDHWLFFPINKGKVKAVTFCLLFKQKTAAAVFDVYVAAKQGDPSGLALMSIIYDYILPKMFTWGDLASKAVSADFDTTRDYSSDMESSEYPFGAPMSKLLWAPLTYGKWPIKPIADEFRTLQYSEVETLLVGGSIDVGTPTQLATQDLLPFLKNGQQVILSERGHMDIEWPHPEACQLLLTSFYKSGVADTSLNNTIPMDFNVGWGLPTIAKVGLTGLCLFALSIGLIIFRWARNVKRRMLK